MKILDGKNLKTRLTIMVIAAAAMTAISIGIVAYFNAKWSLEDSAIANLQSQVEYKRLWILDLLEANVSKIEAMSKTRDIADSFNALRELHPKDADLSERSLNISQSAYQTALEQTDERLAKYINAFKVEDIYLVCAEHGYIMYTTQRKKDFGTSLINGPFSDSSLAEAFERAMNTDSVIFEDFAEDKVSKMPVSFLGVKVKGADGNAKGVLIFKTTVGQTNKIMTNSAGLGETGETYLVGEDNYMRSQSRLIEENTILKRKVNTESVTSALSQAGQGQNQSQGIHIGEDYRGVKVISCYTHLGLDENKIGLDVNFDWAIVAEIDADEAFAPIMRLEKIIIFVSGIIMLIVAFVAYFVAKGVADPVLDGVTVLASAASEISSTVSQIAASSSQSASAVAETTSTVDEVRQTAQLSSENAKAVSKSAQYADDAVQKGREASASSIEGMMKIKDQTATVVEGIMNLSESSQSIGDIISAVSDLAEQSNLLAVNAAIEAAKAGDHGKGFGVVAQEIRSLAEQSKEATARIKGILNEVQKMTSKLVMSTEQNSKAVESGISLAKETGFTIDALAKSVEEAADAATQIAASSQQQLVGMEQAAAAMTGIKDASSQNQESTRQLTSAAENLKDLGNRLKNIIAGNRG